LSEQFYFTGGYTANMGGNATGIGLMQSGADGGLEFLGTVVETSSPSFLAAGPDGVIYATDEANGRLDAFRRSGEHGLTPIGGRAVSGRLPCHVTVTDRWLYVANYGDGSLDVFARESDGSVGMLVQSLPGAGGGPRPEQAGPHAHSTLVAGENVFSADLGADLVHRHSWVETRLIRTGSTRLPGGTGPRDLLRTADGRILVLAELDNGIFELDEDGEISSAGPTVGDWAVGDHAAALAIGGDFLYAGLRGSDRVAVVSARDLSPVSTVPSGGNGPRHLWLAGELLHVANQLSNTVASFRIDQNTGIPGLIGRPTEVPSPTYLLQGA
jgi:6-phosphogluconolactonase